MAFWARRLANEVAVHAVDAQLVTGSAALPEPDRAADGIDEWLWMLTLPSGVERFEGHPVRPGGETLHVHATDSKLSIGSDGEWTIRRTADGIALERGHVKADVALRGSASGLFLLLLRRLDPEAAGVEVLGDRTLLDDSARTPPASSRALTRPPARPPARLPGSGPLEAAPRRPFAGKRRLRCVGAGQAAVHGEHVAGDEGGARRAQKGDRVGNVCRRAFPPQGGQLHDRLHHLVGHRPPG